MLHNNILPKIFSNNYNEKYLIEIIKELVSWCIPEWKANLRLLWTTVIHWGSYGLGVIPDTVTVSLNSANLFFPEK